MGPWAGLACTLGGEKYPGAVCALRGVGRWTAEYVLLRGLGRLHVFPGEAGDRTEIALRAARSGATEDVARFVAAFEPDVRRYITFLRPDTDGVDDLTQETLLRAIASLPRFEGRSSARTWLLSIARRTVVDSVRQASSSAPLICG